MVGYSEVSLPVDGKTILCTNMRPTNNYSAFYSLFCNKTLNKDNRLLMKAKLKLKIHQPKKQQR